MRQYHEQVECEAAEEVLVRDLLSGQVLYLSRFIDRLQEKINNQFDDEN